MQLDKIGKVEFLVFAACNKSFEYPELLEFSEFPDPFIPSPMRIATITGYAVSTVKHPSLEGWRMLIAEAGEDLAPQVVLDNLGAAIGQQVLITSDGSEARQIVGDESSPARWSVLGIIDLERSLRL